MGRAVAVVSLALFALLSALTACSNTSATPATSSPEGGVTGAKDSAAPGVDACPPTNEPDCYPTPLPPDASNEMIINACTDAEAFNKSPSLPLLLPCGQLPPLP